VSTPIRLPLRPLTVEAFAPFGEVIEASPERHHFPINAGTTTRFHALAQAEVSGEGRVVLSIFRGQPFALPLALRVIERHPLGTQAFVPMSGRPWIAVVGAPGPAPAPSALTAFLCRGDQGVQYARGTWHHPLIALEAESDFLVVDRVGDGHNCDEVPLDDGTVWITASDV
jgi:ureidoglycolate lyase